MISRMHIFELWCTAEGSNAEKAEKVINLVELSIKNKGYTVKMIELRKCISYNCKKIVAFWAKYKRSQRSVLRNQSI